ncbi:MAG: hypothetical protein IKV98_09825 [Clostridia bacterium]|nr:hypothetical protein [Clostridia bacterium]
MNERIKRLTEMTLSGEMYVPFTATNYDRCDHFLSPVKMSGKRVCEYIENQPFKIPEECCFTGFFRFDGSVEGDVFGRLGHKSFREANPSFFRNPVDNLLILEWQHSVADFEKIIKRGISGILSDIDISMKKHEGDEKATEFLETQKDLCHSIIKRAKLGSEKVLEVAEKCQNEEYRKNLVRLSESLLKIPMHPAQSFYEAVLCTYFCFAYLPDSIGLIDRYLYPYYKKDIENGTLDKEKAKEYLQELFLMFQSRFAPSAWNFHRGGETHFCIGGYLPDGTDGFTELSKLVVDSLMELPTWIPQISLRWTEKTPREIFRYMLDAERNDKNKRIAFVNDEPRIKGLTEHAGLPYELAVSYTMIGCNELSLPGGMVFGFDPMNILRSVENTFYKRSDDVINAKDFDEFYEIYEKELFSDLWQAEKLSHGFQNIRSRDCNIVSNFLLEGCIENAKSCTQGGLTRYIAVGDLIGISNVIDSLAITKQFVFDEKLVSMAELVDALKNNWQGYEELYALIMKKGNFFGNDDDCSNSVAKRFLNSINKWNNTDNYLGKKWLFGNLIGYWDHNNVFGSATSATPDGRFDGDPTNFGIGQTGGKDRNGICALLNSVAKCDPDAVLMGPSVTNLMLDEALVKNNDNFEKLVSLLETYFKNGGTHFQLTYVSKEELLNARKCPEEHKNLRVRVSGFSDYFVSLNGNMQDEIIERTSHKN